MRVYCDTCVFVDALLNRAERLRPLGDLAWAFFDTVCRQEHTLIISDWVIQEYEKDPKRPSIKEFLKNIPHESIQADPMDKEKARVLSPSNYPDALHVVLALRAQAQILTTRNLRDFAEFDHLISIVLPESL